MAAGDSVQAFYAAREFLFAHREDYDTAYRDFRWPELDEFNWALDHFDAVAADPERGARRALWIVEQDGSEAYWTFAELAERSNRVANWLRERGVQRGDRIILMLGNQVELWETLLAAMKLGAVVIPATTLLRRRRPARPARPRRRPARRRRGVGHRRLRRTSPGDYTRIAVRRGARRAGSTTPTPTHVGSRVHAGRRHPRRRHAAALLHLRHHGQAEARRAHARVVPGRAPVHDVLDRAAARRRAPQHLLAGLGQARLEQRLRAVDRRGVRAGDELRPVRRGRRARRARPLRRHQLLRPADGVADADPGRPVRACASPPAKVVGAGEPLNPEVIEQVEKAWGVRIRDGFGQTETTVQIGNPPGQPVKPGSMGRPDPRLPVVLIDPVDRRAGGRGRDLPGPRRSARWG